MSRKRRNFSSSFKAKVALESIKERETLTELSKKYDLHPNQISNWKKEFLAHSSSVFESKKNDDAESVVDVDKLYAKIGRLEIENDFIKKNLKKLGAL